MDTIQIDIERLVEAQWNANVVPPGRLEKIRRSIEQFGLVENLVARPHPDQPDRFEVLSGNHRLRLLNELGYEQVPVVVHSRNRLKQPKTPPASAPSPSSPPSRRRSKRSTRALSPAASPHPST